MTLKHSSRTKEITVDELKAFLDTKTENRSDKDVEEMLNYFCSSTASLPPTNNIIKSQITEICLNLPGHNNSNPLIDRIPIYLKSNRYNKLVKI